jgi:hypothetical protein
MFDLPPIFFISLQNTFNVFKHLRLETLAASRDELSNVASNAAC